MVDGSEREPERQTGDTLAALLKDAIHSHPDPAACRMLVQLSREKFGSEGDALLAEALAEALSSRSQPKQEVICEALAPLLVQDASIPFVLALTASQHTAGRHLALAMLGQWPRARSAFPATAAGNAA